MLTMYAACCPRATVLPSIDDAYTMITASCIICFKLPAKATHKCTRVCANTYTHTHTYTQTYTHTHTHKHTHTHTHTHIHIHIHTQTFPKQVPTQQSTKNENILLSNIRLEYNQKLEITGTSCWWKLEQPARQPNLPVVYTRHFAIYYRICSTFS